MVVASPLSVRRQLVFGQNALQFHFVDSHHRLTRREAARLLGGTAAALCFSRKMAKAQRPVDDPITRPIPSSGEKLPVIGLRTWQTFDVNPAQSGPLAEVLNTFVKLGGRVVDSSPMYGRAEQVIGDLLTKLKLHDSLFLATKVWTRGLQAGIDSMERSFARLQTKTIDLMQVHNLVDAETQLRTMREWKAQGRFRYLGVTHYEAGAFAEVAEILAGEKLDFVQITTRSWNAKPKRKFYRSRKSVASPSLLIALLAAAIFSVASAENRCPISRQSLIALPGRNFF